MLLSPVTLLVVAGAWVGVRSTSSSTAACETERAACLADAACNACLSGAEPTDYCSQRYPWIFHDGSAGEGAGYDFCEATGASSCCEHQTEEISNQCLTNSVAIAYWKCVMEDEGCEIDDMPCFEPVGWTAPTQAPATLAPITPAPSTPPNVLTLSPAAAPTPTTPETVNLASGAARRFGFPIPVVLMVGLVAVSLFL